MNCILAIRLLLSTLLSVCMNVVLLYINGSGTIVEYKITMNECLSLAVPGHHIVAYPRLYVVGVVARITDCA